MKTIFKYAIMTAVLGMAVSCDDDTPFDRANYVNFQPKNESVEVVDQETETVDVKIYSSVVTGSDRVFDVNLSETTTLDAGAFTLPETVVIPAGSNEGTLSVEVSDINASGTLITLAAKQIDFTLSGSGESIVTDNMFTINVVEQCLLNEVSLTIDFDDWPSETSWAIYDAADTSTPLYSGDGYAGESSFSTKFCLEDGDYLFAIFDAYGDGICCGAGAGSYTLSGSGGTLASGGQFESQEVTPFTL